MLRTIVVTSWSLVFGVLCFALPAEAAEPAARSEVAYKVGPSREYKKLQDVAGLLKPGDAVEVDGNATYPGDVVFRVAGTAEKPITVRGIRVDGKRPLIEGGATGVEFRLSNHMVFEGFEVAGGTRRGLYHHAAFITVRDTLVRDCPSQGIIGSDQDSGSCTLDHVEVARCGGGTQAHPIYMSTDPAKYPGSVFRMQFCYIHDGTGGNAVKTRAERNEIYYNCIEAGFYRELEMIGRDREDPPRPMNSDVVGNLFIKKSSASVVRVGHDSAGLGSKGRYRFVNNTFILSPESRMAIQTFGRIESIEAHNNVFYHVGGAPMSVFGDQGAEWVSGKPVITGSNNWVSEGSTVPAGWIGTILGKDPGFADAAKGDFHLKAGSPLINAGDVKPAAPEGFPFPNPLWPPAFEPPLSAVQAADVTTPRPVVGVIDIGAHEFQGAGR